MLTPLLIRISLEDLPRKIAVLLLVMASLFFSFTLFLIITGPFLWGRTVPFGTADVLLGSCAIFLGILTGWMAYRIGYRRKSSDGITYLGPYFIVGVGCVVGILEIIVIVAAPNGIYYLPTLFLPAYYIFAGAKLLSKNRKQKNSSM